MNLKLFISVDKTLILIVKPFTRTGNFIIASRRKWLKLETYIISCSYVFLAQPNNYKKDSLKEIKLKLSFVKLNLVSSKKWKNCGS